MHLVLNWMHTTSASSQHHLRPSAAKLQHSNVTLKFALASSLWLDRYHGWMLGLLNCFCLSFMSHMHVMFMKSLQWLCMYNIVTFQSRKSVTTPVTVTWRLHCLGTKSDAVGILESLLESTAEHSLNFDAVLYDGAALVNILPKLVTFNQYATEIFCPFILKEMTELRCTRLYIVYDSHHQGNLKAYTRNMMSEGTRRQVKGPYPIPHNISDFL